jgi:hypothetical protein
VWDESGLQFVIEVKRPMKKCEDGAVRNYSKDEESHIKFRTRHAWRAWSNVHVGRWQCGINFKLTNEFSVVQTFYARLPQEHVRHLDTRSAFDHSGIEMHDGIDGRRLGIIR